MNREVKSSLEQRDTGVKDTITVTTVSFKSILFYFLKCFLAWIDHNLFLIYFNDFRE